MTKHHQQREKPHAWRHESIYTYFTAVSKNIPTPTTTKLNAFYQEPVDPHKLEHNSDVIIKWRITFHYFSLINIQKIWHASNLILCRSNVLYLPSFINQSTDFLAESYCHSMMLPPPCISAQKHLAEVRCVFSHTSLYVVVTSFKGLSTVLFGLWFIHFSFTCSLILLISSLLKVIAYKAQEDKGAESRGTPCILQYICKRKKIYMHIFPFTPQFFITLCWTVIPNPIKMNWDLFL